jgi:predicted lipoprotein with Yx(FWY)xxD motif
VSCLWLSPRIVTTAAAVSPATLASAAKLTTTARFDGGPQVLYNGHPLYRFTGTAEPGDINGQRVTAFGAAWFAVSGAGQVVSRPGSKPGGGGIS